MVLVRSVSFWISLCLLVIALAVLYRTARVEPHFSLSAPSPPVPTAPRPLADGTLHVLFVGNSHTYVNAVPETVVRLAAAAGETRPMEAVMVAKGGATLEDHWRDGQALAALAGNRWDYVVLQEQSYRPVAEVAAMFDAGQRFDREIDATKAQTVLFLGWRRDGLEWPWPQEAWTESTTTLAGRLDAELAPIGGAWQKAETALPEVPLRQPDGSHATPAGSYLAACVFYATFYRKSPVGLPYEFADASLSEREAGVLQRIAWKTVQDSEHGLVFPAWPKSTEALYPMAWVYAQEGKTEQAIAILQAYIDRGGQRRREAFEKLSRERKIGEGEISEGQSSALAPGP